MNVDRDRSWLAISEVVIALALLLAMLLPWWSVTPAAPDHTPTGPAYSVGINGLGRSGFTEADVFVWFGPPLLLLLVLLAGWISRRGLVVLSLIAFLSTGTIGAFGLIGMANADQLGSLPTRPDVGLQLFAWLCLAGTIVTAIDITRGGTSTAISRRQRARAQDPRSTAQAL